VSEGEGCGWEGKLGIYTRVSSYLQWIKQNRDDLEVKKIPNFVNVLFGQNNATSNSPDKKVSVIEVPALTTSSGW
jgi:secreted trypsin-like serine protease